MIRELPTYRGPSFARARIKQAFLCILFIISAHYTRVSHRDVGTIGYLRSQNPISPHTFPFSGKSK